MIIKREDAWSLPLVAARLCIWGKNLELEVVAESSCGTLLVVEVKKQQAPVGINIIEDFSGKVGLLRRQNPEKKVILAVLFLGGFPDGAQLLFYKLRIKIYWFCWALCFIMQAWNMSLY